MTLKQLQIRRLELPFKVSFKHSSAERSVTETVIVIADSHSSFSGFGEGCPRSYVTGETIDSCFSFFHKFQNEILDIQEILSLKNWVEQHGKDIDANPAAWCAIETAILDLLGNIRQESIEKLLDLPEVDGDFCYSAVLGVASPKVFEAQCEQYLRLGLNDFKVKVSGEPERDLSNLQTLTNLVPSARIRLDANNLWKDSETAINYLASLDFKFWAIEEPLASPDFQEFGKIARELGCKIVLDESFLGPQTFDHVQTDPETWIPNIRISKMGGLLRSLSVAEQCKRRGLKFILGAQVGETSILTRVALSLANAYNSSLIAQEGAFGTYLLSEDLVETPLMFGARGNLRANFVGIPGLGLNLDRGTFV